jgi:hypothetical protein
MAAMPTARSATKVTSDFLGLHTQIDTDEWDDSLNAVVTDIQTRTKPRAPF